MVQGGSRGVYICNDLRPAAVDPLLLEERKLRMRSDDQRVTTR